MSFLPLRAQALALIDRCQRHPRRVTAAVALGLAVMAGGAMAVADWGDSQPLGPIQIVTESLTLSAPLQAGVVQEPLYRHETTRSADTAESLLQRVGIVDSEAAQFLRNSSLARQHLLGKAGRALQVVGTPHHQLQRLSVRWLPDAEGRVGQRWVMERSPQGYFVERLETLPLQVSTRVGSGVIQSSLFAATDEANLPDAVAVQMAEVFGANIDFHRDLRKGDRFSVLYEVLELDGEALRTGRVLSTEFVNQGKRHQAFWFQEPGAREGGYFTADGVSLHRAYLASPLAFSRVTSGFKMRFHPILQTWRAHLGVDYAAPTGTPVRVVGNGVVKFAGTQGGFGQVVMVQHGQNHTTVYAHLSRILVRQGQTLTQGQTLGHVGATGWATGPHLHFEFRVNGEHRDPLLMARQSEAITLSAAARPAFMESARLAQQQLAALAAVPSLRFE